MGDGDTDAGGGYYVFCGGGFLQVLGDDFDDVHVVFTILGDCCSG